MHSPLVGATLFVLVQLHEGSRSSVVRKAIDASRRDLVLGPALGTRQNVSFPGKQIIYLTLIDLFGCFDEFSKKSEYKF